MSAPQRSPLMAAVREAQRIVGNPMLIAHALITAFRIGYQLGCDKKKKSPAEAEGDRTEGVRGCALKRQRPRDTGALAMERAANQPYSPYSGDRAAVRGD